MAARRTVLPVLLFLACWIPTCATVASANPPDITGRWYGTWEVAETLGYTSNFSIRFWDGPSGLLARTYVPEFGLFDDDLLVTIVKGPAGFTVTIGVEGVFEMSGALDEDSLSGEFSAAVDGGPPFAYTGVWQAKKFIGEAIIPGVAPGPACDDLPPLHCMGNTDYCGELVLFEPSSGVGYVDNPHDPETDANQYFSYIRRDLMLLLKHATAKVACKTAGWSYGNLAPLGLGDMSEASGATPGTSFGSLRHPAGTHVGGRDIDMAYYQLYAADNHLRPVGVHFDVHTEANRLVEPPYALDMWRTALYIAYLSKHTQVRVIGVDGEIGPVLDAALDTLVASGWIDADLRESISLAYEVENVGAGWYFSHHDHMHLSMDPVDYFFDTLVDCVAGPGTAPAPTRPFLAKDCLCWFDSDEDGDVDLADFARSLAE